MMGEYVCPHRYDVCEFEIVCVYSPKTGDGYQEVLDVFEAASRLNRLLTAKQEAESALAAEREKVRLLREAAEYVQSLVGDSAWSALEAALAATKGDEPDDC